MDKRDNKTVNIHTFNDYRGYQKYRGVLTIEQMSRAHQELKDGIKNIQDKDEKKKQSKSIKSFWSIASNICRRGFQRHMNEERPMRERVVTIGLMSISKDWLLI